MTSNLVSSSQLVLLLDMGGNCQEVEGDLQSIGKYWLRPPSDMNVNCVAKVADQGLCMEVGMGLWI